MAKQRWINTKFWDDDWIVTLDPDEKLMYLYLLTNPLTTIAGAYEISVRRIAFDTGLKGDRVTEIMALFEAAERVVFRDGWVFLTRFIKNQSRQDKVRIGIERVLNDSPDWVKDGSSGLIRAHQGSSRLIKAHQGSSRPSKYSDSDSDSDSNLTESKTNKKSARTKSGVGGTDATRLSRLSPDFPLTDERVRWAARECPHVDVAAEHKEFIEFWCDIATKNARRTERGWSATWKKRMRDRQSKIRPASPSNRLPINPAPVEYYYPPDFPPTVIVDDMWKATAEGRRRHAAEVQGGHLIEN